MSTSNHLELSKYTELSLEVYEMDGRNAEGWEFVDSSNNLVGESTTGYFGAIYKREVTDESGQEKTEYAIAHRGTDSLSDIGADIAIGFGVMP